MKNLNLAQKIAADLFRKLLTHAITPAVAGITHKALELEFGKIDGLSVDLDVSGRLIMFGFEDDFNFQIHSAANTAAVKDHTVDINKIATHLKTHFFHLDRILNGNLNIVGEIGYHGVKVKIDFHI